MFYLLQNSSQKPYLYSSFSSYFMLLVWISLAGSIAVHAQEAAAQTEERVAEVLITADGVQKATEKTMSYSVRRSDTATKMDLTLRETPQSVSVVTRSKMDDFKLDDIDQVLSGTTGVTVENVETNRTYYTARGFDITNFQFDGVGVPLTFGNQYGDIDTATVDRIDIVRGANGLISSTGNPSATVNFVRKRPTFNFQASGQVSYGSWNTRRAEVDISDAINTEKSVAARVVMSTQSGNSRLDRYQPDRTVFYGVVTADLGDSTSFTVGHSDQQNKGKGAMWGALPMFFSDGSPTDYGVNTSTAADWSYWNSSEQRTFAELVHYFNSGWQWKTTAGYNRLASDGKLFYVSGTPDRQTGSGLSGFPSRYDSTNAQMVLDSYGSGKYSLAGRQHDLLLGMSWSRSTLDEISHYSQFAGTPLIAETAFNGGFPEPDFNFSVAGGDYVDRRQSAYAATRFNLADRVKWLVGANYVRAKSAGISYDVAHNANASAITPYTGLVVDVTEVISAYASYSEIFNPQYQADINGRALAPLQGKSVEVGLKGDFFSRKLNASAALFRVQQSNAAELAGYAGNVAYYRGIKAHSDGIELDVSGELNKGWQASVGLTAMSINDDAGNVARTYVPKTLLRLATTYRLPQVKQLKIGASLRWQGKTSYRQTDTITTVQTAYGMVDVMARYDISKNVSIQANLNNITNKKALASLYWSQMFYKAPLNGSVSVSWRY